MIGQAPHLSVSDFVAVFNQSLEMLYPEVSITGELSNFRISKNMWVYFDLKDDQASVKFFGTVRSLPGPLEDGMMLEVYARPYLHPKFGFSIQIQAVQAVGEGAINKAQKLLAQKLQKEGLFDETRKRTLPYPPEKIALISSGESAGYGDFIKIIAARWPRLDVELIDVQVQGVDAPGQIVAALESANQRHDYEAIILLRGGGSRDDLAAFDHEHVVRAVAASRIPTLVAVGHERDVSLAELAADMRASTPSNAAELLVPNKQDEKEALRRARLELDSVLARFIDRLKNERNTYKQQFQQVIETQLSLANQQLRHRNSLLQALDPRQPLQRGYALVHGPNNAILRTAKDAANAAQISVEFIDGRVNFINQEKQQ